MRYPGAWIRLLILALGVFAAMRAAPAAAGTFDGACAAHAAASLDALARGEYAAAGKQFSARTAKAVPPAKLQQVWKQLQQALGPYRSHGSLQPRVVKGRSVLLVAPVAFAEGSLDFVAACDASNRITTFALLRPSAIAQPAPVEAHTAPDDVRVEPLAVPSPDGPLRGALTLPAGNGPFPAVVLVSGSGPNDMDESIGANKPLRDIANGLAEAGIASLRYDKRTFDYSSETAADPDFTIDDEVTDDALSALRLLSRQRQIDARRLFVLGHSLGAMLAPRIAERAPHLAGVVMLAAPARPLLAVSAEQVRETGAKQGWPHKRIVASERAIAAERALLADADPKDPPHGSFDDIPQSYWISLHDYHQVEVAQSLWLPMLILQGGSDFQVSPKHDFDRWKQALAGRRNVTFHLYPGLSHLFMPGPSRSEADYTKPAHVDPKVISDIAKWIEAQPPAK